MKKMSKKLAVLLLAVLLTACCTNALAAVRCTCGVKPCICFMQLGDKGMGVRNVIRMLFDQGYMPRGTGAVFTEEVHQAVVAFQKAHRLTQSGVLNDSTLTWLIYGMSIKDLERAHPDSDGQEVWISTDGGTKFHSNPTCSQMAYARKLSARNAQALGFLPCSRCWVH